MDKKRMVAYCGIVCTECDAFIATQAGDREALEQMAKRASEELGIPMTADDGMCDGCLATTGRQIGYCAQCAIRACAAENLVENCAHCSDYPCLKIEGFAKPGSKHRATLDAIHGKLERSA
ncbi:MAG: DUF3795 domain-containing protein [Thermotogota bacterium]